MALIMFVVSPESFNFNALSFSQMFSRNIRQIVWKIDVANILSVDVGAIKFIEKKVVALGKDFSEFLDKVKALGSRLTALDKANASVHSVHEINVQKVRQIEETASKPADDNHIDLFASDSDEESAEASIIREERLAYAAKKKFLQLDIWLTEQIKALDKLKHKLQISCVVEDDKVSIDWLLLLKQIEALEDYVQSVDIAAFNKI
ncbi:probable elongation factor 1-delta [Sitophilus oryzae]|uniref:Probable elongation factor 1-delta n=1 Tax=Sitophilus oryzae TaxID=7048 RepID=A0A6J2X5A4_SITOR|nr:probable elongation factor 1-delta [Sitophilus oryzae]